VSFTSLATVALYHLSISKKHRTRDKHLFFTTKKYLNNSDFVSLLRATYHRQASFLYHQEISQQQCITFLLASFAFSSAPFTIQGLLYTAAVCITFLIAPFDFPSAPFATTQGVLYTVVVIRVIIIVTVTI
jgi:hypothetical protein